MRKGGRRKPTLYHQPEPGEPVAIPLKKHGRKVHTLMYEACCDCGLVHRRQISVDDGRLVERVWRDNRRTAQFRRKKVKEHDIGVQKRANVYIIMPRVVHKRRRRRVNVKYDPC